VAISAELFHTGLRAGSGRCGGERQRRVHPGRGVVGRDDAQVVLVLALVESCATTDPAATALRDSSALSPPRSSRLTPTP